MTEETSAPLISPFCVINFAVTSHLLSCMFIRWNVQMFPFPPLIKRRIGALWAFIRAVHHFPSRLSRKPFSFCAHLILFSYFLSLHAACFKANSNWKGCNSECQRRYRNRLPGAERSLEARWSHLTLSDILSVWTFLQSFCLSEEKTCLLSRRSWFVCWSGGGCQFDWAASDRYWISTSSAGSDRSAVRDVLLGLRAIKRSVIAWSLYLFLSPSFRSPLASHKVAESLRNKRKLQRESCSRRWNNNCAISKVEPRWKVHAQFAKDTSGLNRLNTGPGYLMISFELAATHLEGSFQNQSFAYRTGSWHRRYTLLAKVQNAT